MNRSMTYPAPVPPWSTNDDRRLHWRVRAERIKAWRDAAYWYAQKAKWGDLPPSIVRLTVTYPTARTRDPSNLVGTIVKATVDGLVLMGAWPDDTPEWVSVAEPRIQVVPGWHTVTVDLEEKQ